MDAITSQEILARVAQLAAESSSPERPDGAFTVTELQDGLGWSRQRALSFIKGLGREERLEVVRVPHRDVAGRDTTVPGYRIRL